MHPAQIHRRAMTQIDPKTPSQPSNPWKCISTSVGTQVEIRERCKSLRPCPWATVTTEAPVPIQLKDGKTQP